jgi:hypothetical protein
MIWADYVNRQYVFLKFMAVGNLILFSFPSVFTILSVQNHKFACRLCIPGIPLTPSNPGNPGRPGGPGIQGHCVHRRPGSPAKGEHLLVNPRQVPQKGQVFSIHLVAVTYKQFLCSESDLRHCTHSFKKFI